MLQQTQVATVIPYFERFLKRFPDVTALAAAEESELLSMWEGLGYYRRARSLHAAARQIVDRHDGKFPENYDDVLALPGIGRYTAGAILSISGDQRLPILEGNTVRVFSRWIGLRDPVDEAASKRLLWDVAEKMLPRTGASQFNQAAMELGALVCVPKQPVCEACPVAKGCVARREGVQATIPGKVTKIKYEDRTEFALVIARPAAAETAHNRPRYLCRPIPDDARWAGLWDFPRTSDTAVEVSSAAAAADELAVTIGVTPIVQTRICTLKHGVTKYRITLHVHESEWPADVDPDDLDREQGWSWKTAGELKTLPMSVTGRRIVDRLVTSGG